MMQNRYTNLLQKYNEEILRLTPANETLRLLMALEFKKHYKKGMRVVDLGSGEGHSAKYICEYTDAHLDLIDKSRKMIENSKINLARYAKHCEFICKDASDYLKENEPYDIVLSSWTIHNFKQSEKHNILKTIHDCLRPKGIFLWMDKVYPQSQKRELLKIQLERFDYLPKSVAKAIKAHELIDFTNSYRMDEKNILNDLRKIGFKKVSLLDRIERDVIIIAYK